MDKDVSRGVMMLRPAKKIWQTLQSTYGHEKNIARICEIYEHLFTHRQGERSVQEFYNSLRALLDELEIYQLKLLLYDVYPSVSYHEKGSLSQYQERKYLKKMYFFVEDI